MTRFEHWFYQQLEDWPMWAVLLSVFLSLYIVAEAYNIGNP